jgi:hypothetical protein
MNKLYFARHGFVHKKSVVGENVFNGYNPSDIGETPLLFQMEQQITACDGAGFARSLEAMIATVSGKLHISRKP